MQNKPGNYILKAQLFLIKVFLCKKVLYQQKKFYYLGWTRWEENNMYIFISALRTLGETRELCLQHQTGVFLC